LRNYSLGLSRIRLSSRSWAGEGDWLGLGDGDRVGDSDGGMDWDVVRDYGERVVDREDRDGLRYRDRSIRVDGCSFIGDLSDVSIDVIRGVLDMLSPAIREDNRVRALLASVAIRGLISTEGSARLIISN